MDNIYSNFIVYLQLDLKRTNNMMSKTLNRDIWLWE